MNVQPTSESLGNLRQQKAEARREHLVDTALELFAEQGYDATSIKQIAQRAGVSMGLLYHYFPGKSAIISAVMKRHGFLPELRALLLVSENEPAAQVLEEVASGFSAMIERKQPIFRFIVRESQTHAEVAEGLSAIVGEGVSLLAGYLDSRMQCGELRPHDTALTARALLSAVLTTHLVRLPEPNWHGLVAGLLHGVLAHPELVRHQVGEDRSS